MKVHVEPWAPEYGSPLDPEEQGEAPPTIQPEVEVAGDWDPIPGKDDQVPVVAFVDGVRRPDARIAVETGTAPPTPGVCGSLAVGAVRWHRHERRAEVGEVRVRRVVVCGDGLRIEMPPLEPGLAYESMSTPEAGARSLVQAFHGVMRRAEAELAEEVALAGYFVVADGPLSILSASPKVGYIKTHRNSYLSEDRQGIIARLAPGQRTPVFAIPDFERYSWYLRLAAVSGGHSWSGVVRCEAAHAVGLDAAVAIADRTAALLPLFASELYRDPRAPQNLVPIAGLERELRRRLGDQQLVRRTIAAGVAAAEAAA